MQSYGLDFGVKAETAETEKDGFQGEFECPLASLAAQVDKWGCHGIPRILSNVSEFAMGILPPVRHGNLERMQT